MQKHVIIASAQLPQPQPQPEPLWTYDPWQARWVDATEAAVETALLASLCPGDHLRSWSLDQVGTPRIG